MGKSGRETREGWRNGGRNGGREEGVQQKCRVRKMEVAVGRAFLEGFETPP